MHGVLFMKVYTITFFTIMNKFLLLLGTLFFVACGVKDRADDVNIIEVSIDNVDTDMAAYSDYKFVRLETNDDCFLENIVKAKVVGNDIYLLSSYGGNIYKYTIDGEFLWKLSKGLGPDDLVFPTDFYFEPSDSVLYVLDNYRIIKKYTKDGCYIENFSMDTPSFLFELLDEGYMMFNPNLTSKSNNYLSIYKNDSLVFSKLPIHENLKNVSFMPSNVFVKIENDSYYIQYMLSDTIYCYNTESNEIKPAFYIDTRGKSINSHNIKFSNTRHHDLICEKENLISGIAGLSVLDNKLYMLMYYKEKQWYIVYDINSKKTITTNKLCTGIPNSLRCVGRDDDFVVFLYRPEDLLQHKDEISDKANNMLMGIKEDDNPILVLLK